MPDSVMDGAIRPVATRRRRTQPKPLTAHARYDMAQIWRYVAHDGTMALI